MIHTVHTMTLRRYSEMEQTENLSLLKRWFNVLPIRLFDVEKIIQNLAESLNSGIDRHFITEIAKIVSYNRVLRLQALYMAIYNLIVLKHSNDSWGLTKKKKTNLSYYLETVESLTGIVIKDLSGLERLKKEMERQKDKYLERFGVEIKKTDSIPF